MDNNTLLLAAVAFGDTTGLTRRVEELDQAIRDVCHQTVARILEVDARTVSFPPSRHGHVYVRYYSVTPVPDYYFIFV